MQNVMFTLQRNTDKRFAKHSLRNAALFSLHPIAKYRMYRPKPLREPNAVHGPRVGCPCYTYMATCYATVL